MEHLLLNTSAKVRHEKRNGRDYLVAPMVLLVPGVLNGSQGPLYYPPEEVRQFPDDWNDTPIVVEHPRTANGFVSGRLPEVLDQVKVGRVYNAHWHDGKLKAEGWFDVERVRSKYPGLYDALNTGKPIELSTGLKPRYERAPEGAIWNSQPYTYIARQPYRPDHLAILPNSVGACGLKDGCGVLRNSAGEPVGTVSVNGGVSVAEYLDRVGQVVAATAKALPGTRNAKGDSGGGVPSDTLDMDPEKCCQIMKDGEVHGKELSESQKGMFGACCGQRDKTNNQLLWHFLLGNMDQPRDPDGKFASTGGAGSKPFDKSAPPGYSKTPSQLSTSAIWETSHGGISHMKEVRQAKKAAQEAKAAVEAKDSAKAAEAHDRAASHHDAAAAKLDPNGHEILSQRAAAAAHRQAAQAHRGTRPGGGNYSNNELDGQLPPRLLTGNAGPRAASLPPAEIARRLEGVGLPASNPTHDELCGWLRDGNYNDVNGVRRQISSGQRDVLRGLCGDSVQPTDPTQEPSPRPAYANNANDFFSTCPRDQLGHCVSEGDSVTVKSERLKIHGLKGTVVKTDNMYSGTSVVHVKLVGGDKHDNYGASKDKSVHSIHPKNLVRNSAQVGNQLSLDERIGRVRQAFYDAHPVTYDPETGAPQGICHLASVYDGYVIYTESENGSGPMPYRDSVGPVGFPLYRQTYDWNGETPEFNDDATEVEARVEYVPVGNEGGGATPRVGPSGADLDPGPLPPSVLSHLSAGLDDPLDNARHNLRDDLGRFDTEPNVTLRAVTRLGFGPTHSPPPADRGSDGMGGPAPTEEDEAEDEAHSPVPALAGAA